MSLPRETNWQFVFSSFICYQMCERNILKVNEPILMSIGTSGPVGNDTKYQLQGSRKPVIFLGLAEAPFLMPLGQVGFLD